MPDLQSLASLLRDRKISSLELVEESLTQIKRLNPKLNAFITITEELAREHAAEMDQQLAQGIDHGPLHGIPIAHKDLIRTKGTLTTAGSKIFRQYVPKRDAEIAERLKHAGAVSVGKTGLHELAYGITSNNPHYGPIRNPWDPERIPGGSSGGSAVAVATGMVLFAVGTDTGGSIRVPASFCGVVGLKPTFGRVSVKGVIPLGFSQDHIGPMTRTVRDCAVAFQAMVPDPSAYVPGNSIDLNGVRIGLPKTYFFDRVDEEVRESVLSAAKLAESLGAVVFEIEVPDMEVVRQAGATCLLVEAAEQLKPWAHRKSDLGSDILGYLEIGNKITGVEYLEAIRTRKKIKRDFEQMFRADHSERVDVILTPTTAMTAPKIGQTSVAINGGEEETRFAATRFTRPFNALGTPAISLPSGFSKVGLPIGMQLAGPSRSEDLLLRVAAALEDALELTDRRP